MRLKPCRAWFQVLHRRNSRIFNMRCYHRLFGSSHLGTWMRVRIPDLRVQIWGACISVACVGSALAVQELTDLGTLRIVHLTTSRRHDLIRQRDRLESEVWLKRKLHVLVCLQARAKSKAVYALTAAT
jgi:hypothetical protein